MTASPMVSPTKEFSDELVFSPSLRPLRMKQSFIPVQSPSRREGREETRAKHYVTGTAAHRKKPVNPKHRHNNRIPVLSDTTCILDYSTGVNNLLDDNNVTHSRQHTMSNTSPRGTRQSTQVLQNKHQNKRKRALSSSGVLNPTSASVPQLDRKLTPPPKGSCFAFLFPHH